MKWTYTLFFSQIITLPSEDTTNKQLSIGNSFKKYLQI